MLSEADDLLGREAELAAVSRFLAAIEEQPQVLLLEGEPGIGKTALIGRAVAEARGRGYDVLSAKPTNAENALSFVGLGDLLAQSHELLTELPSPQRRALEAALLLDEPADGAPDPRAIGLGVLAALRRLAASRPVVVAVDDLQWLDRASASSLSFAFRRIEREAIGLLGAIRTDGASSATEVALARESEHVTLGPLSVGAIHALLAERLQLSVPRALLLRVYDTCRGNPLFALEIGRALKERGVPEPGQPFEIPAATEALFVARLEQLPDDTLDALAVAATMASPNRSLVSAVSSGALEPAVRAEIIRFEGDRIRFTHPLLASAAFARLGAEAQRELHRRIAGTVRDQEERARHLARAAQAPDGHVAAVLDEAVERAAARGAPAAAAELAELAANLTPQGDTELHGRRRRIAAERHFLAGDVARSRMILQDLVEELPPGTERARALLQLAEARSGDLLATLPLREQAVVEARGNDRVLAGALSVLARTLLASGAAPDARLRARRAVDAAERTGEVRLVAACRAVAAWVEMCTGRLTPGLLERALALEQEAGYLRFYERPSTVDGLRLMLLHDDLDAARARLLAAEETARDHGDEECRALLLTPLALLECRAGRFDHAKRYADESYELRQQFGLGTGAHLYFIALVDALRGHAEEASAAAERARTLCEETGNEIFTVRNLWVLGLLALSSGDTQGAAQVLAPLPGRLAARGYGPVVCLQVLPDAIEALIAVGDLDRAAVQLRELDTITDLGISYARARASRCRGLLAAAERSYEAAFVSFDDALIAHEHVPDPLERGRTFLALGQTLRRAGRRRNARETLQQALAIFAKIGAVLWAGQTRVELERLGGRASSAGALTGAEQRVARLVAEGKTNREVAAALFVTQRTVETHLSSIYRKLDVRSRTELAHHLGGQSL